MQLLNENEVSPVLDMAAPLKNINGNSRPKFESRPQQQLDMLRSVTAALNKSHHVMIEAGTGIGKSFAYLLPAALWSTANNQRVVISTNTINLQDQLMDKDLPDLRAAWGLNCAWRSSKAAPITSARAAWRPSVTVDPRPWTSCACCSKVLVWLDAGGSGEERQVTLSGPLNRMSGCVFRLRMRLQYRGLPEPHGRRLPLFPGPPVRPGRACHHRQSRLLSWRTSSPTARSCPNTSTSSWMKPTTLNPPTTGALSYRVSSADVSRLFYELGGISGGTLGLLHKALATRVNPSELAGLSAAIDRATDLIFQSENSFKKFIKSLEEFLEQEREGREVGDYRPALRITPSVRHLPGWTPGRDRLG